TGYGSSLDDRQKFTGKERDSESGMDYFLARYYSGSMGRFLSVDPENAGASPDDPRTWNSYAYVSNNPMAFVDPDGREIKYAAGLKNEQLVRDSVTAILADRNTQTHLSGFVGKDAPDLTIQSGDLGGPKVEDLGNGQTVTTTVQGVTEPDVQTASFNGGPKETQFNGATITIDKRTSKGDTPGVLIHESVHAGEAQKSPAQFTIDTTIEQSTIKDHDSRPQEQRANAARDANLKEIKKQMRSSSLSAAFPSFLHQTRQSKGRDSYQLGR
ncbi:MAG: RHS repeat-associated core domain-containing protein, partial [Acidobacteria bacterium]|nr:RHS repeat-associated core domain-containing protein [Acidobacteriota bacterium]